MGIGLADKNKSRWNKGLLTFLLMVAMGMAAAVWADGPTAKELEKNGGDYGKKPAGAPGQAVTTEVKPGQILWDKDKKKKKAPLECGADYKISVTLTEAATCGDWADGNLLQKATDECHDLLETYDCDEPKKCHRFTWYDYFNTGCTDNMAYARVDGTVKCAEENEKTITTGVYPEGVSEVGGELQKNHKYTKGVAITLGDNGQATTIAYPKPLKCDTSQLVSFSVNFVTPIAEYLKHGG